VSPLLHAQRERKLACAAFATLSITWALFSGVSGCFLIFALTTDHAAAHHNHNLLLLSPISMCLVVFAPSVVRKGRFARQARIMSAIVLASALLAVIFNFIPSLRQGNWDLVALAMPIHIALAAALWMWQKVPKADIGKQV
jgi:uncharacterized membrane protein